ncbi:TerD family protein [Streptomyces sp. NPDC017964]|uniref:TerD family protein n=1 Tax=Streptomyces sp. NPDC017964 TaxID=3365022 RepID=UPI0037BAFC36
MGGLTRAEVKLKWDAGRWDQPTRHLDIIAATYRDDAPYGAAPSYVVHTESRSPDGTIHLTRHSETGLGLGFAEVMVLELDRLAPAYRRVMVGVAIHQRDAVMTFADVTNTEVVVTERYQSLISNDFANMSSATAATIAEFTRDGAGLWHVSEAFQGFDADPMAFPAQMGRARQP